MRDPKPKILITKKFPDFITAPLRDITEIIEWTGHPYNLMPRESVLRDIKSLTGIINQAELAVDKEVLELGQNLKIIANVAIGYDNLDIRLMEEYGVWASNTPGHFTEPVAEYIIGALLSLSRKLYEADRFVRSGEWSSFQPGRWDGESIRGKTLGILGMGTIGQSLAKMAQCMGMHIIYHSRQKSHSPYQWVNFEQLLQSSDFLSIHVPYNDETHYLIDDAEFHKMKKGSLFINTSRGKVVRETALIHALKNQHLSGAILDVFENEPVVPKELRSDPKVILSPHIAGGTREARLKCYQIAVDNVIEVLMGNPPINPVNTL